jgi:hypothetical protein
MTPETDAVWKGNDIVKQVMTSRRLERERDEAREIIRKAKVKFCEDGPDGKIAAEMFAILGSLEREYK